VKPRRGKKSCCERSRGESCLEAVAREAAAREAVEREAMARLAVASEAAALRGEPRPAAREAVGLREKPRRVTVKPRRNRSERSSGKRSLSSGEKPRRRRRCERSRGAAREAVARFFV